jgi:hypothetical protein
MRLITPGAGLGPGDEAGGTVRRQMGHRLVA